VVTRARIRGSISVITGEGGLLFKPKSEEPDKAAAELGGGLPGAGLGNEYSAEVDIGITQKITSFPGMN